MEIIKYFKNIYAGRENILKNISLFSIFGIMVLTLNSRFADMFGNYFSYIFGYAPASKLENIIDAVLGILIFIFSIGYIFNYSSKYIRNEKVGLPDINLSSMVAFCKMLPLFFVWGAYYFTCFMWGMILLSPYNIAFCIYNVFIILSIPYTLIILVLYSVDFKYNKLLFYPVTLFAIIRKVFWKVLEITFVCTILAAVLFGILFSIFKLSWGVASPYISLGIRLLGGCLFVYGLNIVSYVFVQKICDLTKKEFLIFKE